MSVKDPLSRITIDIQKEDHKKLKTLAAILGKSMRTVVVDLIEDYISKANLPDKGILKTIENVEQSK